MLAAVRVSCASKGEGYAIRLAFGVPSTGDRMEYVLLVLMLLLLATVIGGAFLFSNDIRRTPRLGTPQPVNINSIKTELDARYQADIERLRAEARGAVGDIEAELGRLREGLRTSAHEHDTQLARLRERYAEVDGQTAQALERALGELRSHQEIELARLREGVGAALAAIAVRQTAPESDVIAARKAEATANLYRKLAKLEMSFLSITNPVLLPGEAFALPAELLPETMKWENWKDVGDAAFSFAEAFNQDRIYLDDGSCRDLITFISGLRELMTTAIYPNLLSKPGADLTEARAALRGALEQLGHEIPDARERLERSFRESN
jgi:hypothetical protein